MKVKRKYSCEDMFQEAASRVAFTELPTKMAAARALIDGRLQDLLRIEQQDEEHLALIDALFALHCLENYGRPHPEKRRRLQLTS